MRLTHRIPSFMIFSCYFTAHFASSFASSGHLWARRARLLAAAFVPALGGATSGNGNGNGNGNCANIPMEKRWVYGIL